MMKLKGVSGIQSKPELERDGVWFTDLPGELEVMVRRTGGSNKEYKLALNNALRPHKRRIDRGTMDPDRLEAIIREVYAKTVIVDWRGFFAEEDDEPIPCTESNVMEFLEAYPDLYTDIAQFAADMANFIERDVEQAREDLGKS